MNNLYEGSLRTGDLKMLVSHIFEVDRYKSKMGSDGDVVVVSFTVDNREVAEDLMSFLEKGYQFVLDADVSPGELSNGRYKVFLELERTRRVYDQLADIIYGVGKLASIPQFKFRYYKNFNSIDATVENFKSHIPATESEYNLKRSQNVMENCALFFADSSIDSIVMEDEVIQFKKSFADPIKFKIISFGDYESTSSAITESISVDYRAMADVVFLTKYIGDYRITKYGQRYVFENNGSALVLERL